MKVNDLLPVVAGFGLLMLGQASVADAAEIKVLCSTGLKAVVAELVPQFERATKHTVLVRYGVAAVLKQQIQAGEPFDVAVLTPAAMDDLAAQGKIAADTRTVIARSGLALAVRSGASKADIKTVEAFKRALLGAKSIAYAKEGASGVAFAVLIQRLAIADALKSKSVLTESGEAVGEAVVSGKAELGVLPVSEILPVHGAEVLGPFPGDTQSYVVMVGGVSATTKQASASADLIRFLTAPAALPVITAKGMEK